MEYRILTQKGNMTVKILGDIDHHSAAPLREDVECAIKKDKPCTLIIDMSGVEFMDSSGFGFIMGRYKSMSASNGTVSVIGCRERILKLLKMSGTDKFVKIEGSKK